MNHAEVRIGVEFQEIGTGTLWRCTDVGERTVVAVCLSDHPDDASWFNGPPYAVKETVFDEDSIGACRIKAEKEDGPNVVRPDADTIIYRGRVYLRPCDRGVCLEDTTYDALFASGQSGEPYADDMFHALKCGDAFQAEVTVKRIRPNNVLTQTGLS